MPIELHRCLYLPVGSSAPDLRVCFLSRIPYPRYCSVRYPRPCSFPELAQILRNVGDIRRWYNQQSIGTLKSYRSKEKQIAEGLGARFRALVRRLYFAGSRRKAAVWWHVFPAANVAANRARPVNRRRAASKSGQRTDVIVKPSMQSLDKCRRGAMYREGCHTPHGKSRDGLCASSRVPVDLYSID